MSILFMTAHRAQGLTVPPPQCRAFVSPPLDPAAFSGCGKVPRLIAAVQAVGGTYTIRFVDVANVEGGYKKQRKLRIIVPSDALVHLVEWLLEMDGWKDMTIDADEKYSDVLARIILEAGGRELSGINRASVTVVPLLFVHSLPGSPSGARLFDPLAWDAPSGQTIKWSWSVPRPWDSTTPKRPRYLMMVKRASTLKFHHAKTPLVFSDNDPVAVQVAVIA
ncbi:hypothetical protein FPV67DRAFT_1448537 [Lyophyllum atratum]|nr:hypothetical protein FPV67DRAFT_1448537 [Lyophyllum atratum]